MMTEEEVIIIPFQETDSLPADDFIHFYGNLDNFLFKIRSEKKVTVAFLGGSITAGKGWREKVMHYLTLEYPETEWNFINAGIPSLGSVPHAFRLERDVLSRGTIDLLFLETAVNDLANGTPVAHQRRALEGIVRHALDTQPGMNIILMAFADEKKISEYDAGTTPAEVQAHDDIARHYQLPFINLANEVAERIEAKEFTWATDFKDLHPSPFGQQLYFRTIKRLFEISSGKGLSSGIAPARIPAAIEKFNYDKGKYVEVSHARKLKGFKIDPSWKPEDAAKTRKGYVDVPMLVSQEPGSSFEFSFTGNAVGIVVAAGPDAGMIRVTIDNGKDEVIDLFTQWSRSLHLPWYIVLDDDLDLGKHKVHVEMLDTRNQKSVGSACRIVHFIINR